MCLCARARACVYFSPLSATGQFEISAKDRVFCSKLCDGLAGEAAAFNGGQSPVEVGGECGGKPRARLEAGLKFITER